MTVDGDPTQSLNFSGTGGGQVINHGWIRVSEGGFAILAAPYVENTGFIKADLHRATKALVWRLNGPTSEP
jgi:hypothetical protein